MNSRSMGCGEQSSNYPTCADVKLIHNVYQHILFEVDEQGIALVTVNRPEKLNALSGAVVLELKDAFERIAGDGAVRAAIVTGAGEKAFVAGADISELAALSPVEARDYAARGQARLPPARDLRKAHGRGGERVRAGRRAGTGDGVHRAVRLGKREAGAAGSEAGDHPGLRRHAAAAAAGGPRAGAGIAAFGRAGDGRGSAPHRAGQRRSAAARKLLDYSRAWLAKVLANGPLALGLVLEAVDVGLDSGLDAGLRFEAAAFGVSAATEDRREGTRAFLEKRSPAFAGK